MILYYCNYFVRVKIAEMLSYNSRAKYFLPPINPLLRNSKLFTLEKKSAELNHVQERNICYQ